MCRALADVVADGVGRRDRVVALASAAHWSPGCALLAVRHVALDRAGDDVIVHDSAIVVDQGASFIVRLPALKKTSGHVY